MACQTSGHHAQLSKGNPIVRKPAAGSAKADIGDGPRESILIKEKKKRKRADAYLDIVPHIFFLELSAFSTEATALGFASLGHPFRPNTEAAECD